MSALAQQHNAINLSQGFPDFPVEPELVGAVAEAMQQGHNQYAPMPGLPALRQRLSEKIRSLYGQNTDPEREITVTPGGTYALYAALTTLLQPGDEVIVPEPAYDSYIPAITLNGGVAVRVPLRYPDFSVDWDRVGQAVSPRTRAIMINTPHNPTGYVWSEADMQAVRALVSRHGLYVISDEVYEHQTFDGCRHESVLRYPDLYARSIAVFSFGKVFHATGWKMGYAVAPPELMSEFRKVHQFMGFSVNTPMQVALARFLANEQHYLGLPDFFQTRRDRFLELFSSLPFTLHSPARGSYFQMLGYEKISSKPDREMAIWLTEHAGVASIPVSAFMSDGTDYRLLRFCFAKKEETLEAAAEKLRILC
jgi:methionine aminotransferase